MKKWEVPASEWPGASRERWQSRKAIEKLDELERKRAKQAELERELRRSLLEKAYDQRRRSQVPSVAHARCRECGKEFFVGVQVVEYVDDDGRVVARYHYWPQECRTAQQRREGDPGRNW